MNAVTLPIQMLPERARWRTRDVHYLGGRWTELREAVPEFEIRDFSVGPGGPPNPHLHTITRLPLMPTEHAMPVGVVSPKYMLVQHRMLGDLAVETLRRLGLYSKDQYCELGLSTLGEWMNLRVHLGDEFTFTPVDDEPVKLRLELMNSVDGSSRLAVMISWLRLVCSNGLMMRDTLVEKSDVHDQRLTLCWVEGAIADVLSQAKSDRACFEAWGNQRISFRQVVRWADDDLAKKWGKKAAARCLHICRTGCDGEFVDLFEGGAPSERRMLMGPKVPGAAAPARTAYDLGQALSWLATNRSNAEQRLSWQAGIPRLVASLTARL